MTYSIGKDKQVVNDPLAQRLIDVFADNLRTIRLDQNLTQERLGYMMDTLHPRISNLERSLVDPRLSDLAELARALDVSPGELVDLAVFHPRDFPLPPDGHAQP